MNTPSRLTRIIVALSIALAMLGVVMVYSSSAFQTGRSPRTAAIEVQQVDSPLGSASRLPLLPRAHGRAYSTLLFFSKQMLWAVIGLIALLAASCIDYPKWKTLARPLTLGVLGFLLLVWTPLGKKTSGATSWIALRWFTIQPAELARIVLVVFLADLFTRKQDTIENSLWRSIPLFAIPGMYIGLVMLQPDLGMATLMVLLTAGMWFLAGSRLRHLLLLTAVGAALLTGVFSQSANARNRILSFLQPEKASKASLYQLEQARIAMAKGGLWGVGLGEGQQKMHFLPAPHTDFIFAVLAEELGFVAVAAVLLAYAALIAAGFYVAIRTPDLFGSLLAGGLSLSLALGVLINIAVVTGCIPTTGLPLPLMSYGGSSLLSTMLGLGITLNVAKNLGGVRKA